MKTKVPVWENLTELRVSFCVKVLLKRCPDKVPKFVEDLAKGDFSLMLDDAGAWIPRKEFDRWREEEHE